MGKADQLAGSRKGSVGFRADHPPAAACIQPRGDLPVASGGGRNGSPNGFARRSSASSGQGPVLPIRSTRFPKDDEDLNADEQETLEEKLVDQATAAKTIAELKIEIVILGKLELQAKAIVASGQDRKWEELSKLLQNNPEMRDESGRHRKIILFYRTPRHAQLLARVRSRASSGTDPTPSSPSTAARTATSDGGKRRPCSAPTRTARILIATDAAGEGVNLQCAHLMVNYDLPWNPNRLEQRFGRIHRIGQTEVCHLWNLVAKETREGDVYHRLLEKLANRERCPQGSRLRHPRRSRSRV